VWYVTAEQLSTLKLGLWVCNIDWVGRIWSWIKNLTQFFETYSQYQNVSVLDFIGATDDKGGGDNLSYKSCKSAVKSSSTKN